ncbi:hypothetical protein [Stackebrandtia soli]|uniref:hypothetical protein n=1 Tax=Stackebrandtia soli TaxID=1892856 RepID=UPI0039E8EE4D
MDPASDTTRRSQVRLLSPVAPRKLAKVPFVELADGRVQGVVSSGSDIARVYVSSVAAESLSFSCGTNNNRRCGGVSGSHSCKHIDALLTEAVVQYGLDRVSRYLKIEADPNQSITVYMRSAGLSPQPSSLVFSRFLRHLTYLERPVTTEPLPELHWFPAMGAH